MAKALFDKIWDSHVIKDLGNGFVLLHIDRLLLHDLSGARALREVVGEGYTPAPLRGRRGAARGGREGLHAGPAAPYLCDARSCDLDDARPHRRDLPARRA